MKFHFIILTIITYGCTSYSVGDLNGKWAIKDQPHELWVRDTLAIGFDFDNQLLNLYRVEYDDDFLTFTNIQPYPGSTWSDRIIEITKDELEVELQNPGNWERRKYYRLEREIPEISVDYETNYQRLESYMISKIDKTNITN